MKIRYCASVIFFALSVLSLSVIPASAAGPGGLVEGRVMFHDLPLEGAFVYAYKEPGNLFAKASEFPPAATDAQGAFMLELPKGQYYIAAKKKGTGAKEILEPGDYYSFYGGNPVSVDPARPAKATLNMMVKPFIRADTASGDDKGGVEGTVTISGEPASGVVLYVYLDANDNFRGMGYYMSPPTGVNGVFKMRMNEGTYYILARKRQDGSLAGPLREGDYFGYLDENPVVVTKRKVRHVEIPVVRKVERVSPGGQGKTLIAGIIKDKEGNPLAGMYACVYKNEGMTDRPAFVSKQTGPDGNFQLEVPLGGKYFLGGRSAIGGPVEPGQYWGRYGGSTDHSIKLDTGGRLEGIDITLEKVVE